MPTTPFSIVVLISGKGSNLQAIINEINAGKINAKISVVISNRPDAGGLKRAKKAGIPTQILDHTEFESRQAFDTQLGQIIIKYKPDLVVLAGFMRILSDQFVKQFEGKLINIHPSLLPAYRGLHTHRRALEDKVQEHGASVHFVIPELDAGNVIIHGIVPVNTDDNETSLAKRVHQVEHQIYPLAIKWIVESTVPSNTIKYYLEETL